MLFGATETSTGCITDAVGCAVLVDSVNSCVAVVPGAAGREPAAANRPSRQTIVFTVIRRAANVTDIVAESHIPIGTCSRERPPVADPLRHIADHVVRAHIGDACRSLTG